MRGAPLAQDADCLPAIEQFGEEFLFTLVRQQSERGSREMQRAAVTIS